MAHSGQDARGARRSSGRRLRHVGTLVGIVTVAWPSAGRADAILTWNNELLDTIRQTSALLVDGPPEVAREIAMVGTAMFDAVNAATGLTYQPYAYTGPAVSGASVDAAALSAGYQVMYSIFSNPIWASNPGGSAIIQNSVLASIQSTYDTAKAALGSGAAVTSGLALGQNAGNAMIANRSDDGSVKAIQNGLTPWMQPPEVAGDPGVYVPPSTRPAMFPIWGTVTPFGTTIDTIKSFENQLLTVQQLNQVGLATFIQSANYANNVLQTECTGSGTTLPDAILKACAAGGFTPGTNAQATSALFWNDPGGTMQPPGHWLQIADNVMTATAPGLRLGELQQARLTALVGIATADAGIGAWDVKYQEILWRPITAIHDCANWNPDFFTTCDPAWASLIATPPHPDYVAGHPAFSGGSATVLAAFFGTDKIAFTSTSDTYCNFGTPVLDGNGSVTGCKVAGGTVTQCNDIPSGGTLFNNSPLICPITEPFGSFSEASNGPNGATSSRVAGGIHTPLAVNDALHLGDLIGADDFANNLQFVPEPATSLLLLPGLAGLLLSRRRQCRV